MQTVPAWFVREHGEKFKRSVRMGFAGEAPSCNVSVNVYFTREHPHVCFARGWKCFARFHNFQKGDRLKFNLVQQSEFNVTRAFSIDDKESEFEFEISSDDEQ